MLQPIDRQCARCSSLRRPGGNALDDVALRQGEDDEQGSDDEDRGRHHRTPPCIPLLIEEVRESHSQGPHQLGVGDDERPEIVVPPVDDEDERHGGQHRARERQHDVPEQAQVPTAIHLGGVQHLTRQAEKALPHQERAEGRRCAGKHDPLVGVDPALPKDIGEREVVRQDGDLLGDHQGCQQEQEEPVLAGEAQEGKGIRGHAWR